MDWSQHTMKVADHKIKIPHLPPSVYEQDVWVGVSALELAPTLFIYFVLDTATRQSTSTKCMKRVGGRFSDHTPHPPTLKLTLAQGIYFLSNCALCQLQKTFGSESPTPLTTPLHSPRGSGESVDLHLLRYLLTLPNLGIMWVWPPLIGCGVLEDIYTASWCLLFLIIVPKFHLWSLSSARKRVS